VFLGDINSKKRPRVSFFRQKRTKRTRRFVLFKADLCPIYRNLSALLVVISRKKVHRFKHLVDVDIRTYNDHTAKECPEPECACSKAIGYTSAFKLSADSGRKLNDPNEGYYAKGEPREDKENKHKVHRSLTVILVRDGVDIAADSRHNDECVNAEGKTGEDDELPECAVCLELVGGSGGSRRCIGLSGSIALRRCLGLLGSVILSRCLGLLGGNGSSAKLAYGCVIAYLMTAFFADFHNESPLVIIFEMLYSLYHSYAVLSRNFD
jgi:hypothetical protein